LDSPNSCHELNLIPEGFPCRMEDVMISRRRGFFFLVLATMLTIALGSFALAAETGQPDTVRLLARGEKAEINLLDKKSDGLTLSLEVPLLNIQKASLGDEEFDTLSIPGGQPAGSVGQPALPVVSRLVALPSGMTLSLDEITTEKQSLEGSYRPIPIQEIRNQGDSGYDLDVAAYSVGKAAAGDDRSMISIGEPGLIRGQRVVAVSINPVSWDPRTGTLTAASSLTARFSLVPSSDGNNPRPDTRPVPESFLSLYEDTVLGFDRAGGAQGPLGTWMVIYPDAAGVYEAIVPLIEWRQREGYNVVATSVASIGSSATAIKAYIQDQYDTLEIPLEFVTLVGDANGTITLPSWRESLSGYNGEGDHDYTRLEGDDILADIHLGRLSVSNTTELTTVVNKIVNYESSPFMSSDPGWFTRAGLAGDPGSSGYSTIWVNQWVKEQLIDLSYTQIDTIWSGNFVTQMMTTINQGESIFTYRGYWGMSGMNTGHIASLSNGPKLPFALVLTCDTGSFWTDSVCRSEAFLRAANGGGVASIGTATIGTHTRYNNCMFQGCAQGVLNSGDNRVGPALTRGKLSMYENYIDAEANKVAIWSTWNNLMGDPATSIWTANPLELTVDYPSDISLGANALPVTVTSGGQPVAGARVGLFMKDVAQVNGITDENGTILLPLGSLDAGELLVTVTGRNLLPHLGGTNVGNLAVAVDYADQALIDDGSGSSIGNGDGLANPGETLEVSAQVANHGTGGASDVTATVASANPLVTVLQGEAAFGYLGIGGSAWGAQPFVLDIDPAVPGGTEVPLEMTITSGASSWTAILPITVSGAAASAGEVTLGSVGGNQIDPGEASTVQVVLNNIGNLGTSGASAVLSIESQWVTVLDANGTYGAIPAGDSGANTSDTFSISVAADCYPGHLASFVMDLFFAEGGTAQVEFQVSIGQAASTDPVGPDGHGYYAFDNTDTDYTLAPVYEWVELDPAQGGSGTSVGLTDYARYQDDTQTIPLPFTFGYYGANFDQISVCSNGWLAMGQTYLRHYRNWTIPSPGAPDNMIAVFWDDLRLQTGIGGVFYWHDVANHRFIVEWSQVLNYVSSAVETFQVMLYDPAHIAGDSGDGLIVAQYHTVNQVDYENGYATAGIQNEDRDEGLLYTYWNMYNGGAAPLAAGRAIAYRTVEAQVQGTLKGEVTNASAGGTPIDNATISVLGSGRSFMTTVAGLYQGGVPIGTYDVAVSHPSFAPDTTLGVLISEGVETVVDFQLTDVAGPTFDLTTIPDNTEDTFGPYHVTLDISDYSGLQEAHFYYTSSSTGGPFELPLSSAGRGIYNVDIPGQAEGTRVQYWLSGTDNQGNMASEPAGAPYIVHSFVITSVAEIYATDMETDEGWTAGLPGDTATTGIWNRVDPNGVYSDTATVQPEDDHTVDGVMCWITGNDPFGSNQGTDDVDGGLTTLETPVFDVAGMSGLQLNYYRWYTNDTGQNPGSDYWRVQASTGNGTWVNLEETTVSNRSWLGMSFLLDDYLTLGDQLIIRFLAEDAGNGSVVEAGVDDFSLIGYNLPGDGAAPEVALTSFGGGQVVAPGATVPVTWNHSDDIGVVQVDILLSTDSGSTFDQVLASGPLNQAWDWAVPATASSTCRLKVVCHDAAGNATEAVSGADFTIDAQTPAGDLPVHRLALSQNTPNPFNPRTEIRFSLPSRQTVSLKVYNVEGRLVRTLLSGRKDAGTHTVVWSGEDDRGGRAASGLYFYRLGTDSGVLTRKMILLK
jgi:hypothetical protein